MDRASDSGSEGWGFESLPAYQNEGPVCGLVLHFGSSYHLTAEVNSAYDNSALRRIDAPLGAAARRPLTGAVKIYFW